MQYPWVISSVPVRICSIRESYPQYPWGYAVPVSHILSTREDMQYPWVISSVLLLAHEIVLNSVGQASEIKCRKLVTKNTRMFQKLSLLAVHLRQSLTPTVLMGLKVKMKYQPALLFIQVKTVSSLWQTEESSNYEISQEIFSFLHLSHWINCLH